MRVILIEDHLGVRAGLKALLELEGHEVLDFERPEEALGVLGGCEDTDLVLLDLHTGGLTADRFSAELRELFETRGKNCPRLGLLSGSTQLEDCASSIGADFFIRKPFQFEEVLLALGLQAA